MYREYFNAFSQDTFAVVCYNLTEEHKIEHRSVKSSSSSVSNMKIVAWKMYLLEPLDFSKPTARS